MFLRRRANAARIVAAGWIALVLCAGAAFGAQDRTYRGRPLVEVLEELRAQGLNLVFSSSTVNERLLVSIEPEASDLRALLGEILEPLGLEARDGPAGAILIVRRDPVTGVGTLTGRVLSAALGAPIARAVVAVETTGERTTTRPDGTFEISGIPAGTSVVVVEAPGYATATTGGVGIREDTSVELVVTLTPNLSFVEQIVVTPSRHSLVQQEQASRVTLDNEDAVLVPTIGGDISRVIALLPGIAGADNSATFNVRGSQAQDVSLVIDGLELYEPFHLGSFQSPFSVIDSKLVDTIDVLVGGFTADYGDRHGGFVELSTVLPGDARRSQIEVGTVNSRVSYSRPTRVGSVVFSGRAWYPRALRDTIELDQRLEPRFEDAYVKLSFHVSPRTALSVHGLFARDRLEFTESGGGNERVDSDNRSGYLWLRALRSWTPSLFSETVLSAGSLDRTREGISEPEDVEIIVDDDRSADFFGLKHHLSWEISSSKLLKAGIDVRTLRARYRYTTGPEDDTRTDRLDPSGTSLGLHVANRFAVSENLAVEVGARWDRQTYTNDNQFSPRFNGFWRVGDRSEMRFGVGRFFQSQRIYELRVHDGRTVFVPAELARQVELTYQRRVFGGLRFRVDAYDRRLSRVHPRDENLFNPLELFPETESDRVPVEPTRASFRGVEVLLRSDPEKSFHWWAGYAWSSAEDTVDGADVPRSWDQTHALKFLVGYRRNQRWAVSLSGAAHSGWPTTPVTGQVSMLPDGSTQTDRVIGPRNSDRYPWYARLDVKGSRTFSFARSRLRLEFEVVNATDRNNVCCVDEFFFELRPDGTVDVERTFGYWLGITPSFSLLWEF